MGTKNEQLSVPCMLDEGISIEELAEKGLVYEQYYEPSGSYEYYDGECFYNRNGVKLRDPDDYDSSSIEGYTPFGDE